MDDISLPKSSNHKEDSSSTSKSVLPKVNLMNSSSPGGNFINFLVSKGLLDQEVGNKLKLKAMSESIRIEDAVLNIWDKSKMDDYHKLYAEFKGWKYIDLNYQVISGNILKRLGRDFLTKKIMIPFRYVNEPDDPNLVKFASGDPLDLQSIKFVESVLQRKIEIFYSNPDAILKAIRKSYSTDISHNVASTFSSTAKVKKDNIEDNSIINVINMMMEYAVNHNVSDIHIEPRESKISVRFRILGVLYEKLTIENINLLAPLITRIKIMSDLRIDEHRIPQDGRFSYQTETSKSIDVRVSTVPSLFGEKVVMRILDKNQKVSTLEELGFRYSNLEQIIKVIKMTQGLVLVTGPTGSGKTRTLSTILNMVNRPEVNIMTLEDPVEIQIDGVNQVQVNPDVGLTFSNGLRAFLRQDPDIIMVGEIRDGETASLAVQASLVGRMVYSTVHTNSSASTFTRLLDMGVQKYMILSTIKLIIGQRLIRVLCPYCKKKTSITDLDMQFLLNSFNNISEVFRSSQYGKKYLEVLENINDNFYQPVGCPRCNNTGYFGRIGIFECMYVDKEITSLVNQNASEDEIEKLACQKGMITMFQDGILRVLDGETTITELVRVIQ